jgi:hypothetical protein
MFAVVVANSSLLNWTVLGDWGNPIWFVEHIAARSVEAKSQFVMAIGDNFYMRGVESVHDPKWKTVFENEYTHEIFQSRWYVIVGNHDYLGNVEAQLKYANISRRWYYPSRYYKVRMNLSQTETVDFVYIDTTPLVEPKHDDRQLAWLHKTLAESDATWVLVIGHHEIYSLENIGVYLKLHVNPLLEKFKVAAYICGHHHSQEHHQSPLVNYVVTGNVGFAHFQTRVSVGHGIQTKFRYPTIEEKAKCQQNGSCRGFTTMSIESAKSMAFTFFNSANEQMYSATIINPRMK